MKLLVTGGSGFIGSRLALQALAQGQEVVVTGQINSDTERLRVEEIRRAGVVLHTGPLQDAAFARRIVEGCDRVIHLAAAQHEAKVPDSYFEEINVGGTRALIEASRDAGVRRFVHGSTIGIYGSAADGTLDEESTPRPDNIYGRTKLAAEGIVRAYENELEICIVRISETYGPGDFRLLKLFRAIDSGAFMMVGHGQNCHQVMHVSDLVRALFISSHHPAAVGQTFVLPGSEVLTTRGMVAAIAAALGKRSPRLRLPLWPFVAAAAVFEATLKPLGINPPLHQRRLDFFRKSFVFSTHKAETLLGFVPQVSFADGARDTAFWYRAQGHLSGGSRKG